jgi:glutathione S-transferase
LFFFSSTKPQNLGVDISQYPKLAAWYENCKTLPGFDENEVGAKIFASAVLKNATDKF